jgi:hypothetical protein
LESLFNKSDETLDKIQVDSSGNQEEPDIDVNEEQNLNSSKDDLAPRLPTLNETLEPSLGETLLLND